MTNKRLNVGLIGLGEVAQVIHLPVLQSLPEQYRIAAICDISQKLVEQIGSQYNVENLYTDMNELVKQADLDIVFVLNSDEYHAECAIQAANNKKHVFIEKPMCLTNSEADAIIEARDRNGVQIMIGYMRRYAASFVQAVQEIGGMDNITYARVRDIIGQNHFFIRPTSRTVSFDDIPEAAKKDRSERAERLGREATGLEPENPLFGFYRLLAGLGSHDLSAMREAIGMPKAVLAAKLSTHSDSIFLNALFDYGTFSVTYEMGMDQQGRFDAHVEVYASRKSVKVQYDTPYIRHLPTKLLVNETEGETYTESVIRPTFTDSYTLELKYLHEVITQNLTPKTTVEDSKEDLKIYQMVMDALKASQ
ncbi:Gfo/Idh/MocA family oxidoreductase [Paenibacillus rhizovicinus]|uniref:Gfo/Idh/MocA family oxidoreductase n=1 Tax=Paenibacillus rhizovicinus TaxID=2704463 RepID=A0A6C0NWH7_9BACL|nr:Gfo/Idh/MocA family oxidoreductase [Paenibacillus rhizovicinus]QHW30570.1 Gfo/Idh/MocA family oxidoreductase [Paenibacillus rhizovicinus]